MSNTRDELWRLNPTSDMVYPINKDRFRHSPPTKGAILVVYQMALAGSTIEEMYDAVREGEYTSWSSINHWDGPDDIFSFSGQGNGLGMLRMFGDLHYQSGSQTWKLILPSSEAGVA